MNIVICDDNIDFLNHFKKVIELQLTNAGYVNFIINKYSSNFEEINYFCDIYFIDIEMPHISGFDLSLKIKRENPRAIIVFVSAREDKVFDSFEYSPLEFIRKNSLDFDLKRKMLTNLVWFEEEKLYD